MFDTTINVIDIIPVCCVNGNWNLNESHLKFYDSGSSRFFVNYIYGFDSGCSFRLGSETEPKNDRLKTQLNYARTVTFGTVLGAADSVGFLLQHAHNVHGENRAVNTKFIRHSKSPKNAVNKHRCTIGFSRLIIPVKRIQSVSALSVLAAIIIIIICLPA